MKFHHHSSLFSSPQHLLKELENLINVEANRSGKPWISVAKLSALFHEKYGVLLEDVMPALQGDSSSLRSFLKTSKCFLIYGTSTPQRFYIALSQTVSPGLCPAQTGPIKYRIKRPWNMDSRLLRMLKEKGGKEIQPRHPYRYLGHQRLPRSEIKSVSDLEITLMALIQKTITNYPQQVVTMARLSQQFCDCYGQPIRSLLREVCPGMKFVDLLQTMPNLHVQRVNNDWQITVKAHTPGRLLRRKLNSFECFPGDKLKS